jgi:cytochrome P450
MNLFDEAMRRDPYPAYAELRRASPLFRPPGSDLWAVFDYEGVRRALGDHEAFSSAVGDKRGGSFEWLLFLDPPRHAELRAIVSRAFTPRSIAELEPRVRQISRDLLDRVVERGELDVAADFAVPLPLMVIADLLGVDRDDWPRFKGWADAIIDLGNTIVGSEAAAGAAGEAFAAADAEMRGYFGGELEKRRSAPRDDLLSRLANAEVDGGRLNETELVRFVQLLVAAGTETTTNLIDNAVLCLLEHPAERARLLASPGLLPSAIEEVLRYRSPVQAMFRTPTRDVELGGRAVPAGAFVLTMIGSANRDPARFAEPDRFDVGRDPNPHVAFGHGIHFCLGAPLSRLEARIALADFLARVRDFEPASDGPWRPRSSFHVHGPTSLPLRFRPGPRLGPAA